MLRFTKLLNLIVPFGLGSFIQRDFAGGGILLGISTGGAIAATSTYFLLRNAGNPDFVNLSWIGVITAVTLFAYGGVAMIRPWVFSASYKYSLHFDVDRVLFKVHFKLGEKAPYMKRAVASG